MADLSTRKPIVELTPADLDAYPIWEYAMDEEGVPGQDETWVRPVDARRVPPDACSLTVATEFRAARGQCFPGFSIVSTRRQLDIEPVVLLVNGAYLHADDPDELTDHTGLAPEELFPMTFELCVSIEGDADRRRGTLS